MAKQQQIWNRRRKSRNRLILAMCKANRCLTEVEVTESCVSLQPPAWFPSELTGRCPNTHWTNKTRGGRAISDFLGSVSTASTTGQQIFACCLLCNAWVITDMKWDTALTQGIHNLLGRISVFIYKHSQIVPRVQEKTSLKKKKVWDYWRSKAQNKGFKWQKCNRKLWAAPCTQAQFWWEPQHSVLHA